MELNKFFSAIDVFNLPNLEQDSSNILSDFSLADLLDGKQDDFSFYTYEGTLTSPPCLDKTIYFVASDVQKVSTTVVRRFKEALAIKRVGFKDGDYKGKKTNARSVQELRGRPVFFYEGKTVETKESIVKSHWEEIEEKVTIFEKVKGSQPSGIPGAIVVPEKEIDKRFII